MSQENALSGQDYLRKILLARIYPVARLTPLHKLEKLSDKIGGGKILLRERTIRLFTLLRFVVPITRFVSSRRSN